MIALWQAFYVLGIVLMIIALYQIVVLNHPKVDITVKLLWALFVIFVPLIGSIAFFCWKKKTLEKSAE